MALPHDVVEVESKATYVPGRDALRCVLLIVAVIVLCGVGNCVGADICNMSYRYGGLSLVVLVGVGLLVVLLLLLVFLLVLSMLLLLRLVVYVGAVVA